MAESEAEPETQFEDLDDELKQKIFSHIKDKNAIQLARHVCRSWLEVINSAFGIKLVINNLNCDLLQTCDSADELELNSLTLPIDVDQLFFREKLRVLSFYNIIVSYNLFPLLHTMTNLAEVNFHDVILDLPEELIEPAPGTVTQPIPNVQKLFLQSWNFASSLMSLLAVLSRLEFKKLKEAHLHTTFTPFIPFQKIFIPSQHNNAELHPFVRLVIKNLATLQLLTYGPNPSHARLKFAANQQHETQDTTRVVQLEELVVPRYAHPDYAPILQSQRGLKVLDLGSCKFDAWTDTRACILANSTTLEKVTVKSFTFGQDWSCDVFANAKVLDDLTMLMNSSPKTSLHLLPVSLTKLTMDGSISRNELEGLYHLVNLVELNLLFLGMSLLNILPETLDVDFEEKIGLNMVKSFLIKLPKLKSLAFRECSTSSLDWERISNWLDSEAPNYGISVEQHAYDIQGHRTPHGFTLKLPQDVERKNISIDPQNDMPVQPTPGMIELAGTALYNIFH